MSHARTSHFADVLTSLAYPTIPAGAVVMSGGIFAVAALGELPLPRSFGRVFVVGLLVLWVYLVVSYLERAFRGRLRDEVSPPMGAFAVGTWVAGCAVLGRAILENIPAWQPLSVALWLVAVAVAVFYAALLPSAFREASRRSGGFRATGLVLLPVVAVQSLVVSGDASLPGGLPGIFAVAVVCFGVLLYIFGVVLIVRRYTERRWSLSADWDDSNCILHGALSISGLAALQTGSFPDAFVIGVWSLALAVFVLVEGIELVRAFVRVRRLGVGDGLIVYHTPQWARVFTFGMFYAFTLQAGESGVAAGFAEGMRGVISASGQYVVLAALLAEIALFFRSGYASKREWGENRRKKRRCGNPVNTD